MKVIYITNIPTPYRNLLYNQMQAILPEKGIEFEVWYMAWTEIDRFWEFEDSDFKYTYKVFEGKTYNFFNIKFHVNPKLVNQVKKSDADMIIIGGFSSPSHFMSAFNSKAKHTILWSESNMLSTRKNGLLKLIKRFLLRPFDEFFVPGTKAKEYLKWIKPSLNEELFFKFPNLIDQDFFVNKVDEVRNDANRLKSIREKYNVGMDDIVWFCPARLESFKGLDRFVPLLEGLSNYKMLIAGTGSLKAELETIIEDKKLNVSLIGQKNQEEILELYAISNLFVLPSLKDPSPLSPIEAGATKLAIMVSKNIGNLEDVLVEGENGFLLDPNDPNYNRKTLQKVTSLTKEALMRMGDKSRANYFKNFDVNTWINNHANDLLNINAK